MRPRLAPVVLVPTVLAVLTGCGFKGAKSFPLPGGVATGSDATVITVQFSDALDLVPQSSVKVNDVTVGSVGDIELGKDDQGADVAIVEVRIRKDVVLPANTTASLRQTSLLGEKFVSLDAPAAAQATGRLASGAVIAKTTRNVEIEEVLSALSLVLNGGGLEQVQTISREITLALKGREPKVRDLLTQLDTFVGGLDAQKADIVRALDSLDRLTARLSAQRTVIATALRDLPGGAKVLADQRADLTRLLTGLDRLGDVSVRVIDATQANTVADLKALQPILAGLNSAGSALPRSLELLATYPFPREVDTGIRGDYANLYASIDLRSLLSNPLPHLPALPTIPGLPALPSSTAPGSTATPTGPTAAPSLPGVVLPALPVDPTVSALNQLLLGGLSAVTTGGVR
jgi:phospholipid/cholesterol/gamma-HCH transport system substrate-binding protein